MLSAKGRTFVFVVAALVALFAVTLSFASAKTYDHGKTVWFSDTTIGDGDEVRGDLDIVFGTVTCEEGATIDGNVRIFGGRFDPRDGCAVNGRVISAFSSDSIDAYVPWLSSDNPDVFATDRGIFKKLAWDVVVIFAFLLFPLRVRVALDRVEKHPGLCAVAGVIALVAAIPILVLLAISILGLPLIPLEIAALFAGLWIGQAAVALLIGRRLYELLRPHTTPSPLGALVVGLVIVTAAQTLPVVGWAVTALVWLVGLGAAVLAFVREASFHSFTSGAGTGSTPGPTPPMNRPA